MYYQKPYGGIRSSSLSQVYHEINSGSSCVTLVDTISQKRFPKKSADFAAASDDCCADFFASSRRIMHNTGRGTQHVEYHRRLRRKRALQITVSVTARTRIGVDGVFEKFSKSNTPNR